MEIDWNFVEAAAGFPKILKIFYICIPQTRNNYTREPYRIIGAEMPFQMDYGWAPYWKKKKRMAKDQHDVRDDLRRNEVGGWRRWSRDHDEWSAVVLEARALHCNAVDK